MPLPAAPAASSAPTALATRVLDKARQWLDRMMADAYERDDRKYLVELMRHSRELNRLRAELRAATNPIAQAALTATAEQFAQKALSGFRYFTEEVAA